MTTTKKDTLHLLAIFHYVIAGLITLVACIPLLYMVMGISLTFADESGGSSLKVMGTLFIVLASLSILVVWGLAFFVVFVGRNLDRQTNYQLCIAGACAVCLFLPLGTILGIFTLISLHEDSVKALFNRNKIETFNELPMDSRQ
ncbi:MAG: hypothetical protein U9P42_04500 [Candidatus Fermentibacteria bacterium]|nr:hypothetical protein [Candidatus Fermentibacteria bacterium]